MTTVAKIVRAADEAGLLALARHATAASDDRHPVVAAVLGQVLQLVHDEAHRRWELEALEAAWRLPGAGCEHHRPE